MFHIIGICPPKADLIFVISSLSGLGQLEKLEQFVICSKGKNKRVILSDTFRKIPIH